MGSCRRRDGTGRHLIEVAAEILGDAAPSAGCDDGEDGRASPSGLPRGGVGREAEPATGRSRAQGRACHGARSGACRQAQPGRRPGLSRRSRGWRWRRRFFRTQPHFKRKTSARCDPTAPAGSHLAAKNRLEKACSARPLRRGRPGPGRSRQRRTTGAPPTQHPRAIGPAPATPPAGHRCGSGPTPATPPARHRQRHNVSRPDGAAASRSPVGPVAASRRHWP